MDIKKIIEDNNLTQYRFAKITGATESQVSKWVRGINQPGVAWQRIIKSIFGKNI